MLALLIVSIVVLLVIFIVDTAAKRRDYLREQDHQMIEQH